MDMEIIIPRTCKMCYGTGSIKWYKDENTFEVTGCECKA